MGTLSIFAPLVLSAALVSLGAQDPAPKELGAVQFARDLDGVLWHKPTKPVFLLFQEIPG